MSERLGTVVSAVGAVLILVGVVWWLVGGDDDGDGEGAPTTATSIDVDPTTAPSSTSTSVVPASSTSTSVAPAEDVASFFADFVDAIDRGDVSFLLSRLHPIVLAQSTADLCPGFVEREILALVDYRMIGPIEGPQAAVAAGEPVDEQYRVPVAFELQGETFESVASFAPVDGRMHWFAECR